MTGRKNSYVRELQKIATAPAVPTDKTRAQLESEIAQISAELKGPMDSATRLDLVEARTVRRKQLEAMA